ncbi:metallophosphoesterase [Methylobacterium sp. Leaf99]|uniref:metallophosphoesterase n=1 Tax=Methylobacterium sp. Leaf99 TaxID=1736251 RepID=UPI0006FC2041|nr:metallophosphoesterase [Methylobacterium sp. Leaf99]KQP09694.1 metallophosphoesterase [Methylobacterium sp. Leaf99]
MLILPSRRQVLGGIGAGAALGLSTGAYALFEPRYRLVVTRYAPVLPRWTPGLRLRVAVLADFHVGEPFMPLDRIAEIVDATNALAPDLTLMLGDYPAGPSVTFRKVPLLEFARVVEGLRAPLGVHAILGNHDWWDDAEAQAGLSDVTEAQRVLEARGIPVMENTVLRLEKDGHPFWIAGLGDQEPFVKVGNYEGRDDLSGTLARITDSAPVLLMVHEPDIFLDVPDRVSLTLAGHTHGGQIRLFGYSPVIPSQRGNDFAYGHVVLKNRHMIVSGGFGVSRVPVRLGVPPEIVLLELGHPAASVDLVPGRTVPDDGRRPG